MLTNKDKADLRRVRKNCRDGLEFCRANGIKPTQGMWITGTEACAVGAVLQKRGYSQYRGIEFENCSGEFTVVDPRFVLVGAETSAARELGVNKSDIKALIEGFDSGDPAIQAFKDSGSRLAAFERLGRKLAEEYVYE